MMVLLKKREKMTDEEFAKFWLEKHAPLAKKMPGLRKYVCNVVQRPPTREPDYGGIVELWFDDKESMKRAFASPEGQAANRHSKEFTSNTITLFMDEYLMT